jgi:peptidoglycan/LPS O-acetylase OafA/YrhL
MSQGYRADIDGLRAVAVLAVLAFHYEASFPKGLHLDGGFTGVDVFFTISGFLITQQIADDVEEGTFSIARFYARRVRRILPALLAMLAAGLFAGRFLLLPGDYMSAAASGAAAASGVSNFYFLFNTGYFDRSSELMPFLHTWSLGVEEQFYVVWPAFLLLLGKRYRLSGVLIATLSSIAACFFWLGLNSKGAFYMAAPRAWELGLGALLVFLPPLRGIAATVAPPTGLLLIVAGFAVAHPNNFPGPSALLPCLGAALVIWPRVSNTVSARGLSVLRPIGLISYSLYLCHWPIWVMFRMYANGDQPTASEAVALTGLSLVIAALSYQFVERPFRTLVFPPHRTVAAGMAACVAAICATGLIHSSDGLPGRLPREYFGTRSLEVMWEWHCRYERVQFDAATTCTFGPPWNEAIHKAILWGESNAEHLMPILESGAIATKTSVAMIRSCPATTDGILRLRAEFQEHKGDNDDCPIARAKILDFLSGRDDVETVIIAASWRYYLDHIDSNDQAGTFERALQDLISRLTRMRKRIVLVATIPQWPSQSPLCLFGQSLMRRPCATALARSTIERELAPSFDVLQRVAAKNPSVIFVQPVKGLCHADACALFVNGQLIYRDAVHFRRNLNDDTNREIARMVGLSDVFVQ